MNVFFCRIDCFLSVNFLFICWGWKFVRVKLLGKGNVLKFFRIILLVGLKIEILGLVLSFVDICLFISWSWWIFFFILFENVFIFLSLFFFVVCKFLIVCLLIFFINLIIFCVCVVIFIWVLLVFFKKVICFFFFLESNFLYFGIIIFFILFIF